MIAQPVRCTSLQGALSYLLDGRDAAVILASSAVAAWLPIEVTTAASVKVITARLGQNSALRPDVARPFRHLVLSIKRDETLGDEWVNAAVNMLKAHGIDPSKHDFIVIRHFDKDHEHIHIIWCRVGSDGTLLRDHLRDGAICQTVCRAMEKKFGLLELQSSISESPPSTAQKRVRRKRPTRPEFEMAKRGVTSDKEKFRQRLEEAWPAPHEVLYFADLVRHFQSCQAT